MSSMDGTHISDQKKQGGGNATTSQYMSFVINERTYAIPLTQVAEITPYHQLNQMPHMPRGVEGLLDLRGSVLPVVSLRTRMGLPKREKHETDHILILAHEGSRIGVLVDQVESVITATEEQHASISSMLEGADGTWVREILLRDEKVVLVLEPSALASMGHHEKHLIHTHIHEGDTDLDLMLDESLNELILMAGSKPEEKIEPQLYSIVEDTEKEVTRVLDCVESMFICTDQAFSGIARFRQEVAMNGLKGFERLDELNKVTEEIQNGVFDLIHQLQFQDIVRQKLERVLRHIVGMRNFVDIGFK